MKPLETLKKRKDFVRISRTGERYVTSGIVLLMAPKFQEGASVRVGFTASKKLGNAVKRNRAKRRLRALARAVLGKIDLTSCDCILIARTRAITGHFHVLENELAHAAKKLKQKVDLSVP